MGLINDKKEQLESLEVNDIVEPTIERREKISEQIRALKELKEMAVSYGFEIGRPAANSQEAE